MKKANTHLFELLLTKDQTSEEDWHRFVSVIGDHVKGFWPFKLRIRFEGSTLRYFLESKHQLAALSEGLDGFLIRRLEERDKEMASPPTFQAKLRLVKFPLGGTLLDLKERQKVKSSLDLQFVDIAVQRIGNRRTSKMTSFYDSSGITKAYRRQLALFPAHLLAIDFAHNTTYIKKSSPAYLNIEKSAHILLSEDSNALLKVSTFPFFDHDYFLNLTSYEFNKHSLIIGSSGSGKSKLIELYIDRLQKTALAMNHHVVVIDPHAALQENLGNFPDSKVINFSDETTQLFPESNTDISAATELTTTLVKSLIPDQFNPRLERVLRFSLYVLFTAQSMDFNTLKEFLTDLDTRNRVLEHVKAYVPKNLIHFFGSEFNEIKTQNYNEGILPIISLVEEMQLQPAILADSQASLAKTIQDNYLSVFSLNKVVMGEKVVRTVAGLLIQQIFLLAQARVFNKHVILVIDEVSVVQNPAIASILAEARKFNLSIILSQQYFSQVDEELRASIVSNVVNYYIFKISEEDAKSLVGNINIELPDDSVKKAKEKGLKESDLRARLLTELSPRQCVVRVSANGQVLPAVLASTPDAPVYDQRPENVTQSLNLKEFVREKLPPKLDLKNPTAESVATGPSGPVNMTPAINPGLSLSEVLLQQNSSRLNLKKGKQ